MTRGEDGGELPAVLAGSGSDAGWYGEGDLWVWLESGRSLGKFPIFTMDDGDFTDEYGRPDVRVTRLDGPGRARAGFGGYATAGSVGLGLSEPLQWWPTGIRIPRPGCWLIAVSFRDSAAHIVTRARPADGPTSTNPA